MIFMSEDSVSTKESDGSFALTSPFQYDGLMFQRWNDGLLRFPLLPDGVE